METFAFEPSAATVTEDTAASPAGTVLGSCSFCGAAQEDQPQHGELEKDEEELPPTVLEILHQNHKNVGEHVNRLERNLRDLKAAIAIAEARPDEMNTVFRALLSGVGRQGW